MSPDGTKKPSPEERLLNLIRGGGAGSGGTTPRVAAAQASLVWARELRWPRLAAVALGLILAVEVVILIMQATRPLPTVSLPRVHDADEGAASLGDLPASEAPVEAGAVTQEPPSLAASASRALFAPPVSAGQGPAAPRSVAAPSAGANQLASRLTLLGIVAGDPAQAIIEDSQTRRSYFVTVGQVVVEGAMLDQVLDNRVILDLAGEKIELTL